MPRIVSPSSLIHSSLRSTLSASQRRPRFQNPSRSRENRIIFPPAAVHLSRRRHDRSSAAFLECDPLFSAPYPLALTIFSLPHRLLFTSARRLVFPRPETRQWILRFDCPGKKKRQAAIIRPSPLTFLADDRSLSSPVFASVSCRCAAFAWHHLRV